jgi:hypothetical protein
MNVGSFGDCRDKNAKIPSDEAEVAFSTGIVSVFGDRFLPGAICRNPEEMQKSGSLPLQPGTCGAIPCFRRIPPNGGRQK